MAETEIIFSVQESVEGGYEARALGHDIFTQAESLEELRGMVRERCALAFQWRLGSVGHPPAYGKGRGYARLKLPRDLSGHDLAERFAGTGM
jgi:hypothetical protein